MAVDPEPNGPPSSLRAARIAWAAVSDDATHHLVLQDDVVLTAGFAGHVTELVTRWPEHAIALYVNWNSPYNSYRVRCAVLAGRPWAPLAPWEWVPTLGLVLPTGHARALAGYLTELKDGTADDDAIGWFCADRRIPVLAAVPHLLEHAAGRSLAGSPGVRHAAVTAGLPTPGSGYWRATDIPYDKMTWRYSAVSLYRSRCYIRHWAADGSRSLGTSPALWARWSQRCELVGVPRDRLVAAFRRYADDHQPVALEFWAAGFLLGAETGRVLRDPVPPGHGAMVDDALRTWVLSGLDDADARLLGTVGRRQLARLCAVAAGHGAAFGATS